MDSDGFGAGASFKACAGDANISSIAGDCEDAVTATRTVNGVVISVNGADIYPLAAEVCANINVDNTKSTAGESVSGLPPS